MNVIRWTSEQSAEKAIRLYLELHDWHWSPTGLCHKGLSLVPAAVVISRYLQDANCRPCNARLFDTFLRRYNRNLGLRVQQQMSHLELFHPTNPSATDLLALVQDGDGL